MKPPDEQGRAVGIIIVNVAFCLTESPEKTHHQQQGLDKKPPGKNYQCHPSRQSLGQAGEKPYRNRIGNACQKKTQRTFPAEIAAVKQLDKGVAE